MSRCDERLKARVEESACLTYTGLHDKNKLEIPNDKGEVNTREIHKCDGQAHDPDTMVSPLTPKPTRKAEALAQAPSTIASSREEDAALKEVALPRYRCANGILETKAKEGSTDSKTRP